MDKEELVQFNATVIEQLPDARFRVRLDNGHEVIAYMSGKMKKHRIRVLAGDRVTVEMSPYDLTKGRVVFRQPVATATSPPIPAHRARGGTARPR